MIKIKTMEENKMDFVRSRGYGSNGLGKLATAGIVAGGLFLASAVGFFACSTDIKPGQVGIKINKWGGGIEQTTYGAGRYLAVPGMHEFKTFPKTLQFLSAGNHTGESEDSYDSERRIPQLTVELSGGGQVYCDYTLVWKITDPLKVLKIGPGKICEDSEIIPRTTNTLRKHLGELIAEEFYNTSIREPKVLEAKTALNAQLTPLGIEVVDVLLRFYSYPGEYQDKIELKILEEQLKLEALSQKPVAIKKGLADTKAKEWEATVQSKVRAAENKRTEILAEAEGYQRQKRAEGDLLVKKAEAEGKELISRSLEGAGGNRVAALKAVEMLRDLDVYIFDSSQVNIFDTMKMIEQLEGTTKQGNSQQGGN